MKRLVVEVYKLLYMVTRQNAVSTYAAILYITILNLITLQGMAQLMEGWLRIMSYVRYLFIFPVYILTGIFIYSLYIFRLRPLKNLKKERQKLFSPVPVIIYTAASVLLWLYMHATL